MSKEAVNVLAGHKAAWPQPTCQTMRQLSRHLYLSTSQSTFLHHTHTSHLSVQVNNASKINSC